MSSNRMLSRREFLRLAGLTAAGATVVACVQAPPVSQPQAAAPTQAPPKPTEAPPPKAPVEIVLVLPDSVVCGINWTFGELCGNFSRQIFTYYGGRCVRHPARSRV
jgi:hypothetical protein